MGLDYTKVEEDFHCACKDVIKSLSEQYKAGGIDKLEAFFKLIQKEFKLVESLFIKNNDLSSDAEAVRRVKSIAKNYAKQCIRDYGKIKN